ncbi:hypothetical protein KI387_000864, partial [Taxus chinensis]
LSHWCIFHRKKAKQVVETWDRQFHCAPREQRVPYLYLANDILQNSRRKGSEFVGEFWKVLPGALRDVFDKGDEHGRNAAMRLVDIWEERKVFGSRGQILKEELMNRSSLLSLDNNTSSAKHLHSSKLKLPAGSVLEKIVSAYQSVRDGHLEEDAVLVKCKSAASCVEKIEKDLQDGCKFGDMHESNVVEELREHDNVLRQCIQQLSASEMNRVALISQLREALEEEESKLEQVRSQLQAAQCQSEQAGSMCQQMLNNKNMGQLLSRQSFADNNMFSDIPSSLLHENQLRGDKGQLAPVVPMQPISPFADNVAQIDEDHKKAAAAVAAKLAASTSSAQMLSYVLSSLASEAASMSSGLRTSTAPVGLLTDYPLEKRQKIEQQPSNSEDGLPFMVHPTPAVPQSNSLRLQVTPPPQQVSPLQHQVSPSNLKHQSMNIQHQTSPSKVQHQVSSPLPNQDTSLSHQVSPLQPQHQPQPQPPPPPPLQYMEGVGSMMGMSYGYGGGGIRRPPPLPGYPILGLPPPGTPHYSIPPNPYQSFQPPDINFYNQPPLPTAPPISRQ